MSSRDATDVEEEFDQFLVQMKPYVLQLPHKSERQRCALWIKKLCEPPGHGITPKKNRNMYSKLLLHMLKKGIIEGPFSHKPDPGLLQTLPSYMSIYFDEPTQTNSPPLQGERVRMPPSWISGELEEGSSRRTRADRTRQKLFVEEHDRLPGRADQREMFARKKSSVSSSPLNSSDDGYEHPSYRAQAKARLRGRTKPSEPLSEEEDDDRIPKKTHLVKSSKAQSGDVAASYSWVSHHQPQIPETFQKTTVVPSTSGISSQMEEVSAARQIEREIELQTKLLEARFHEEKLTIQQKHDTAIQKILDRKNAEIEEMKSHYRSKTKELEETNKNLERKAQNLTKESATIRDSKDKQIKELRKLLDQSSQSSQNHFEKRLHEALADIEEEKFDMQKQHTKAIQEILEDTNLKLQQMEGEYGDQVDKYASVIKELENRIQQLTRDSQGQVQSQNSLSHEKADLERQNAVLKTEIENMRERIMTAETSFDQVKQDHEREMRSLKNKHDATIDFIKQEHNTQIVKITDSMHHLEQQVQDLKQSLQDSELNRQRQTRELEAEAKQDRLRMEHLHEKKTHSLQAELEQERQSQGRKVLKLEDMIKEKDEQNAKLKELQRLQSQQAERALDDFKKQVERNSGKMFDDMKQQMVRVEADLARSKELRERQSQEYEQQKMEERRIFEKQLSELHQSSEQEKMSFIEKMEAQKEAIRHQHDQEMRALKEKSERRVQTVQKQMNDLKQTDTKEMAALQNEIHQLRLNLQQSDAVRKQEVVELGLLREEEKQKLQKEHELELSQLKSGLEEQRLKLLQEHSIAMEETLEQTNSRLKEIQKEYSMKLDQSSDTIQELQTTIDHLQEETEIIKSRSDMQLQETVTRLQDEKELMRRQITKQSRSMENELEKQRSKVQQMEKKVHKQELDHREQLTQLKQEYEDKMKGLLSANIRQELEDTIASLKSQVHSLHQRALLLQEEVDFKNIHHSSTSFAASTPIIKS